MTRCIVILINPMITVRKYYSSCNISSRVLTKWDKTKEFFLQKLSFVHNIFKMLKNQIPVASVINVYWEIKLSIYCRKTQLYRYQAREQLNLNLAVIMQFQIINIKLYMYQYIVSGIHVSWLRFKCHWWPNISRFPVLSRDFLKKDTRLKI